MIGAYAIPLSTEPLYCLHEGDHWDSKRPFWDQVESHPSCNGPNLSLEYELPHTHIHTFVGRPTEGELHHICRMEPVLVLPKNNYLCSIMPAKLLFLFQPVPVFVGNLAQNSTRLSLSNEPILLIRSCLYNMPSFLLLFHTNNTLSITFKHETIAPKIFGYVSLFLSKLCMIIHVHKDFWEFKV
jgi:hypothetical protein